MSGSDLDRLASYLLKEWGDHPAWAIDETCPQGKGAVDLAIEILQQCKEDEHVRKILMGGPDATVWKGYRKYGEGDPGPSAHVKPKLVINDPNDPNRRR